MFEFRTSHYGIVSWDGGSVSGPPRFVERIEGYERSQAGLFHGVLPFAGRRRDHLKNELSAFGLFLDFFEAARIDFELTTEPPEPGLPPEGAIE